MRRARTAASTPAGSPKTPPPGRGDIVWRVQVQPAEGEAWVQEFGTYTPAEAVAGFIAALVAHSPS